MTEMFFESFAKQFGGEIEITFEEGNSPAIVASRLDGFSRNLSDMTAPMVAMRQRLIENVTANFEGEHDPEGVAWQDWAPSYAERAQAENIGILRKTEDLFHAATDIAAYPIIGDDIWMNTGGFPDYWAVHNYGSEAGPGRAPIPQREYLGLSLLQRYEMVDILDNWLTGEINFVVNPLTGGAQRQGKGGIGFLPLGTIGPATTTIPPNLHGSLG